MTIPYKTLLILMILIDQSRYNNRCRRQWFKTWLLGQQQELLEIKNLPVLQRRVLRGLPIQPRYRPAIAYNDDLFNLDWIDDIDAYEEFRFTRDELCQILPFLALEEI
jgi:hypothetical protein